MVALNPGLAIQDILTREILIPKIDAHRFGATLKPGSTHNFSDIMERFTESVRKEIEGEKAVYEDFVDQMHERLAAAHVSRRPRIHAEQAEEMEIYDHLAAAHKFLRCMENLNEALGELAANGELPRSERMVLASNLRIVNKYLINEHDIAMQISGPLALFDSTGKGSSESTGNAKLLNELTKGLEDIAKALNIELNRSFGK